MVYTIRRGGITYIVNPVRGEDSPSIHPLIEGSAAATDFLRSHLGGIHGHDNAETAHTDASYDAADIPAGQRASFDCLDHCADNKDEGGSSDDILAAVLVCERIDEEAREERAELLQSDCERADLGLGRRFELEIGFE